MRKLRGSWGSNGNIHGNFVHLLPLLKALSTGIVKKSHRKRIEFIKDNKPTYEGEKLLARVKFLIPFLFS